MARIADRNSDVEFGVWAIEAGRFCENNLSMNSTTDQSFDGSTLSIPSQECHNGDGEYGQGFQFENLHSSSVRCWQRDFSIWLTFFVSGSRTSAKADELNES